MSEHDKGRVDGAAVRERAVARGEALREEAVSEGDRLRQKAVERAAEVMARVTGAQPAQPSPHPQTVVATPATVVSEAPVTVVAAAPTPDAQPEAQPPAAPTETATV